MRMRSAVVPFIIGLFLSGVYSCSVLSKKPARSVNEPYGGVQASKLRRDIVQAAYDYVGTKYQYAGTKPSTGFDCSGFTYYVLMQFRVNITPASANQAKYGREVVLNRAQPGDLIFFGDNSRISHVALVIKNDKEGITCIHSTSSRGVIVENVSTSNYWKPRILFVRDVIGK
jgi:cell wall-associated NlpC family hydrolase